MARLPLVGGDSGNWGDVLNDFLRQVHNDDGSLKANSVGVEQLRSASITGAAISNDAIEENKLSSEIRTKLNTDPVVADGSITTEKLANHAVTIEKLQGVGQASGLAGLGPAGHIEDHQLPARLSATSMFNAYAPTTILAYDDFSQKPAGPVHGSTPVTGATWIGTGATPPFVEDGGLVSNGTGYAWSSTAEPIARISAEFVWRGTDGTASNMVMAISSTNNVIRDLIHITVSFTGIRVDFLTNGAWSTTRQVPMQLEFRRPIQLNEQVLVSAFVTQGAITVSGPGGESATFVDGRIAANLRRAFFLEPLGRSATAQYPAVLRVRVEAQSTELAPKLTGGNTSVNESGMLLGSAFSASQTAMGRHPQTGLPSVIFAPTHVQTFLAAAASAGATSIQTTTPIPVARYLTSAGDSQVVIEPDSDRDEVLTVAGNYTGTGPFTQSLSAPLQRAHPKGAMLYTKTSRNTAIEYNPTNGFLKLPTQTYVDGTLYVGAGLDVTLGRSAPNTLSLGVDDAFRTGRSITANRPSASAVGQGAQFYDTTLNRPIWSDGANWRDSQGVIS